MISYQSTHTYHLQHEIGTEISLSNEKLPECYVNTKICDSRIVSAMNSAKHTFTFDLKNGDGSKLKKPTYDRTKTEIVKYIYPHHLFRSAEHTI